MEFRFLTLRFLVVVLFAGWLLGATHAEPVPNGDFTAGDQQPASWELVGGQGRWIDHNVLEVTGGGDDSCYWRTGTMAFTPGRLYRFAMGARHMGGSGSAIAGPAFANRDYTQIGDDWQRFDYVFRVPDGRTEGYLRLGQWHATGSIQFDEARLTSVLPVHRAAGSLVLGEGESIVDGRYSFRGTFGGEASNYHRTLDSATADFNSNRWCFGHDSQVVYRFAVPDCRFTTASAAINVNYHTRGGCSLDVSRDGTKWHPLATQDAVGSVRVEVPKDLLPAESLLVRLRSEPAASSFQVDRVEFDADLDNPPSDAAGSTRFLDIEAQRSGLTISQATLDDNLAAGRMTLDVTATNTGSGDALATLTVTAGEGDRRETLKSSWPNEIPPGKSATISVTVPVVDHGEMPIDVELATAEPNGGLVRGRLMLSVPDYYRTDYGRLIDGNTAGTAVWWCDATRKIPRERPVPAVAGREVEVAAARNDFEAVQIVVRPTKPLRGLTATVRSLLPGFTAENVSVLRVYYHYVDHPTDKTGVRDWWPDALPPLDEPVDVPAGVNQPLWVLFHVPDGVPAGSYPVELQLMADGFSATVPIRLHVWDFALPERNHIETAFGLSAPTIFRYHQLTSEADKRRVFDMYLKSFAEHRISPYDPAPLDSIRVHFEPEAEPPRAELDFAAFDAGMSHAFEKFPLTNFRLPIQGMGGGTFHARSEPKIGKFGEGTPEYQAMFSSYVKQVESHLRQKGWLDAAYVYWFDEPAPKDYAFVRNGMERLKRYAPGLTTMLTEQPCDELAGPVDIWCPVTPNYDDAAAEKRRAAGDRFWWYVCTGPKAPYCTLFIDHPATELRVWLWQTWQRDIRGILVWSSNYWTSGAAYPDEPQNPYDDPMGYRSGYSTPRGVNAFWGNGDGRFVYPPLAAAVPGASGDKAVLAPPASSIRWEMLREGIEDYEYLYLLRDLLAKRRETLSADEIRQFESLLEVPESIATDMTTFTTDSAPIYTRRRAIAEAIERLSK